MNYHIAEKHSKVNARFVPECKNYDKDFQSFYILTEHKRKKYAAQRSSGAQNFDVAHVTGDIDYISLKKDWKRANFLWLTVRCRMGDAESTF